MKWFRFKCWIYNRMAKVLGVPTIPQSFVHGACECESGNVVMFETVLNDVPPVFTTGSNVQVSIKTKGNK